MNENAFLWDILAHPDDDTPRLVLADWLDDHGQADRAELIRTQCELAALPDRLDSAERRADLEGKEFRLLGRVGRGAAGRWVRRTLREATNGFPAWELRRGLVETVSLPSSQFVKIADELFARHPIRHVRTTADGLPELSACSALARLTGLELGENLSEDEGELRALLQATRLPHLRSFALRGYARPNLLGALPGCSALNELTSLAVGLGYMREWDRVFGSFLTSVPCERLTELALEGPSYNSSPLTVLASSPLAGRLRSLTVNRAVSTTLPTHPGPLFSSLRALRLRGCTFAPRTNLHALLGSPQLAKLMVLDLRETSFPYPQAPPNLGKAQARLALHVEALLAPHLSRLTTLLLADQRLGDDNVGRLAAAPNLAHLTELNLAHNDLGAAGARAIAGSFPRLRKLSLRGNALGPAGAFNLLAAPFLPQLWWLDLWNTGVNDAVAQELIVRAPSLPNLAWLDLRANSLSLAVRERLRAAFGPAVRYDAR